MDNENIEETPVVSQEMNFNIQKADEGRPTAVFWRRTVAFIIDMFLLGIVGYILGFFFDSVFMKMGNWGKLVGFIIGFIYFVPLDSHIGQGQTIGKRIMKVKVVNETGNYISLQISSLRYFIVSLAIFLNGLYFKDNSSPFVVFIAVIFFCALIGIVYFYVFNRRTRQSLQDIICKTYVVRASSEDIPTHEKIAKIHYYVSGALLAGVLGAILIVVPALEKKEFFRNIEQVLRVVNQINGVRSSGVIAGKNYFNGNTTNFVRVNLISTNKPENCKSMVDAAALAVLKNYPDIKNTNSISVGVIFGYDLGIYSFSKNYNTSKTPDEWKKELGLEVAQ